MLSKKVIATLVSMIIIALFAVPGLKAGGKLDVPHRDWPGTYRGRSDGRRALLTISTEFVGDSAVTVIYNIELKDLDRGASFSGQVRVNYNKTPKNIIPFSKPLTSSSGNKKDIQRLLLHTWDTDYISGYSTWNGRDFGLLFERTE